MANVGERTEPGKLALVGLQGLEQTRKLLMGADPGLAWSLVAFKKGNVEKAVQKSVEHLMESGKWLEEYLDVPTELLREKEAQVSFLLKNSK